MKKVAIVGTGIAGMHAAKVLASHGVAVEMFERERCVGGVIYTGIPDFRMPKTFIDKLYGEIVDLGVKVHLNYEVDKSGFASLLESFDHVLLAIGAQVENLCGFELCRGFESGLKLLYNLNVLKQEKAYKSGYSKVFVWGGGNVAMDCSRSLARLGLDVTVIYRRSEKEMPASNVEVRDAKKDGVKFSYLKNIKNLIKDDCGNVVGLDVVDMELGEMDESGRASCREVLGSNHEVPCDLLVASIGQKVDVSVFADGLSILDGHKCSMDRVWVCGDCYLGPKTIGACMVDGKACAKEILEACSE